MKRGLLVVALALLLPATASAETYPGQRPANDAAIQAEVAMSVAYWQARAVTGCPDGIETFFADSLLDVDGIDAIARGGDCLVWFSAPLLTVMRNPGPAMFTATATECAVVLHEVGHALGLPHTESGVMSPTLEIPWACAIYAKNRLPRRASARDRIWLGDRQVLGRSRRLGGYVVQRGLATQVPGTVSQDGR